MQKEDCSSQSSAFKNPQFDNGLQYTQTARQIQTDLCAKQVASRITQLISIG
jgi:hypothetical protein